MERLLHKTVLHPEWVSNNYDSGGTNVIAEAYSYCFSNCVFAVYLNIREGHKELYLINFQETRLNNKTADSRTKTINYTLLLAVIYN